MIALFSLLRNRLFYTGSISALIMVVNIQFRYISCKFMCTFYQQAQIRPLFAQPVTLLRIRQFIFLFRDCRSFQSFSAAAWVLQAVFVSKTHGGLLRRLSELSPQSIPAAARVLQAIFALKTHGGLLRRLSELSSQSIPAAARVSQTVFVPKTHGGLPQSHSQFSFPSDSAATWVSQAIFFSKTHGARLQPAAACTGAHLYSHHRKYWFSTTSIFAVSSGFSEVS